jgi:N-acetylmuramoyl-L-alanine amidase
MKRLFLFLLIFVLASPGPLLPSEKGLTVKAVRFFSYAAFTRVVLEIEAPSAYVISRIADGRGLVLAAYEGTITLKSDLPAIADGVVSGIESREDADRKSIVIHLHAAGGEVKDFVLHGPDRIVLDIAKSTAPAESPAAPVEKPVVIVLDAGHGGKDSGIVTAQGQEKSITLDLAYAVKKTLQKDRRLKVIMTRDRDVALTLDERAAAANGAGADVFIAIHGAAGAGGRVYTHDPDEGIGSQTQRPAGRDFLGYEAGSEQQARLWDRQQASRTKESSALGRTLARQLGEREPAGAVSAPLAGIGPVDAGAVLIEIGLERDRKKTAQAIAQGILQHVGQNR